MELGYEVVEEFHDEGRTRPGLDQLLVTIRDRKASALAGADLYRIGRTVDASTQVMKVLDEADVPLYARAGSRNLPDDVGARHHACDG